MLEWLGERFHDQAAQQAAALIEQAVQIVLDQGQVLPPDLGGEATTAEVGDAIAQQVGA